MENRQEKSRREVRDFNLKTGRLASGEPFDFATDFVLDQDRSLVGKVKVAANVTADLERNVHRLAEPKIDVTVSGAGLSGGRRAGRGAREIARSGCRQELYSARRSGQSRRPGRATGCPRPACRWRSARRIAT